MLSQNDAGNQLQVLDATMRAEFNKTGSSSYHLRLNPVVHDAITIVVPNGQGYGDAERPCVHFGDLNIQWWRTRIQNLNGSLGYVDPTHLPLYLTKDVGLYSGNNPSNCCTVGFHGSNPLTSHNNNGGPPAMATSRYRRPPGPRTSCRDFSPRSTAPSGRFTTSLIPSHEISEWADDPFITNTVEPWSVGDSSAGRLHQHSGDWRPGGLRSGSRWERTSTFRGRTRMARQTADGYYHPEDETTLPWFMRLAPNYISEPTQSPSTNIGRYTFMGDLNQFPGFQQPATGCN